MKHAAADRKTSFLNTKIYYAYLLFKYESRLPYLMSSVIIYIGSSKLHTAYSWISFGCLSFFISCASLKKSSGFIDPEIQTAERKEQRVDVIKDYSYLHRDHVGIAKIAFCFL